MLPDVSAFYGKLSFLQIAPQPTLLIVMLCIVLLVLVFASAQKEGED